MGKTDEERGEQDGQQQQQNWKQERKAAEQPTTGHSISSAADTTVNHGLLRPKSETKRGKTWQQSVCSHNATRLISSP